MDIQRIKDFSKKNFLEGTEGHEIFIMLLTLQKDNKITEEDIFEIMKYVFDGNVEGILNSMNRAKDLVNDDLLKNILRGVDRK